MMKAMLDKMQMPKKAGEEDEMLALEEGDMENEGEAPASAIDLAGVSDEELLAELKKRGIEVEGPEVKMEMEEEA